MTNMRCIRYKGLTFYLIIICFGGGGVVVFKECIIRLYSASVFGIIFMLREFPESES